MPRIVAGELKGRRIDVPRGAEVRPTGARVREALFSILGDRVAGARVLDLYAGTGALGFEAASRGAASVSFVESDRKVVGALERNIAALDLGRICRVHSGPVAVLLDRGPVGGPYDLVLADPPYAGAEAGRMLEALSGAEIVASGGVLVLERPARPGEPPLPTPAGLERYREARYGHSTLIFYSA